MATKIVASGNLVEVSFEDGTASKYPQNSFHYSKKDSIYRFYKINPEFKIVEGLYTAFVDENDNPFPNETAFEESIDSIIGSGSGGGNSVTTYVTNFEASIDEKYKERNLVSFNILAERTADYPAANVLHDVCEFTIQQPIINNNYRIYTPVSQSYNIEVVSTSAFDDPTANQSQRGVSAVRIWYLQSSDWTVQSIDVTLNGTTPVTAGGGSPIDVIRVLDTRTFTSGDYDVARGNISIRTTAGSTIESPWTGQQTLNYISQGGNKEI